MTNRLHDTLGRRLCAIAALASIACGSPQSAKTNSPSQPSPPLEGIIPRSSPVDESCKSALKGPYKESLAVPQDVVITGDDYAARIEWGGPLASGDDDAVEGYRVCWGPKDGGPRYGSLFTHRIGQIYGVQNGNTFVAYVQSVDGQGNTSAPSAPVEFTGDPRRVQALAQKLTGFFDDFNGPAGPVDELKWNVAYSACNDTTVNGTFTQDLHAVNMIGNHSQLPGSVLGCDRNQNINRAREVFDFTGREGLIAFDFDGSDGDRNTWYVDVFPYEGKPTDLIDITGHVSFEPGPGHPGRFLRFSQSGNIFMINAFNAAGDPLQIFKADTTYNNPELRSVLGVMRHWELRVAKNHASITVDGTKVLDVPNLALDFEKGIVTWDQFNYNPAKIGRPWTTFNFDNFGFDGPKSQPRTHNYKLALDGADSVALGWATPAVERDIATFLQIPDPIEGAKVARFFYTINNANYKWDSGDSFTINGNPFAMPQPKSPTGTGMLIDNFRGFCVVHEVPPAMLVQGTNEIAFHAEQTLLRNLHLELDFGADAPSFTQPAAYLSQPGIPEVPLIGPTSIVSRINDKQNNMYDDGKSFRLVPTDVKGTVTIAMKVDNERPLLASARNLGVSKAELLIDKKVFQTIEIKGGSPAPGIADLPFTVDTSKLSNGPHEVFVVAYDSAGTKGRIGYHAKGETGLNPDEYAPIIINVSN